MMLNLPPSFASISTFFMIPVGVANKNLPAFCGSSQASKTVSSEAENSRDTLIVQAACVMLISIFNALF